MNSWIAIAMAKRVVTATDANLPAQVVGLC